MLADATASALFALAPLAAMHAARTTSTFFAKSLQLAMHAQTILLHNACTPSFGRRAGRYHACHWRCSAACQNVQRRQGCAAGSGVHRARQHRMHLARSQYGAVCLATEVVQAYKS
eukprot:6197235-Pleurochrysis_carterae.AAC.2